MKTKQHPAITPGPLPSSCDGTVPAVLAAEPGVSATRAECAWLAALGPGGPQRGDAPFTGHRTWENTHDASGKRLQSVVG
jgi:hypothetical protein